MKRRQEVEITRHLAGEATPEERRALEARLASDPELARDFARRDRAWQGLELPPAAAPPPGFAARIAARARAAAAQAPAPLPPWARAAAAAALVAGCLAGVGVGALVATPAAARAAADVGDAAPLWDEEESLASAYLAATATAEAGEPAGEESTR